ncbi:alpha/beta hydrolase [Marinilabilia sp.]|uniref:alpha/beta fold hydrolase n=1 Tax=Marinilabilia sp. TaxID=2021252 RepID=UPI0025C276F0|nr:alpha/beta hydrolase [Marinilabilia sp.]
MHIRRIIGKGGAPVLFLHGFLESGEIWNSWLSRQAWIADLLIADLPGHGKSREWENDPGFSGWSEVLMNQVDELYGEAKQVHLVGHSMGGYLALEMALLFPRRIGRIVLLHSTPMPDTSLQIQRRKRQIALIEKGRKSLLVQNVGLSMFAPENRDRLGDIGEELNREARKCSDLGMVNTLNAIMDRADYRAVMTRKMREILLITGGQDPFMPAEYYKFLLSKYPEMSHFHFEGCGHASFLEVPVLSLQIVKRFLDEG